jgi:MFS family permease
MNEPGPMTDARLEREFWLLAVGVAIAAISFQGMAQLLKVLYVLRLGFDAEFVGIMFALGSACFALSGVPSGALGSRFGTRTMMIAGVLIAAFAGLCLATTAWLPPSLRLGGPLAFEVISPVGWSFVIVNQVAALTTVTTASNRKRAYGLKEGILGLGAFTGFLLAGFLPGFYAGLTGVTTAQAKPYGLAVLTSVGVGLLALAPLVMVRPARRMTRPARARSGLPPLLLLGVLALSGLLNAASIATARVFASAYLDTVFGLPTALIGTITGIGTLLAVGGALSSERLTRRRGAAFGMIITSYLMAAGLAVMGAAGQWAGVAMGLIGTIGFGAMWVPSWQVVQMELVADEWRGLVAGAASMATAVGFASMSILGGRLAVTAGYPIIYVIGALLGFASGVLMVVFGRLMARHVAARHAAVRAHGAEDLPL